MTKHTLRDLSFSWLFSFLGIVVSHTLFETTFMVSLASFVLSQGVDFAVIVDFAVVDDVIADLSSAPASKNGSKPMPTNIRIYAV